MRIRDQGLDSDGRASARRGRTGSPGDACAAEETHEAGLAPGDAAPPPAVCTPGGAGTPRPYPAPLLLPGLRRRRALATWGPRRTRPEVNSEAKLSGVGRALGPGGAREAVPAPRPRVPEGGRGGRPAGNILLSPQRGRGQTWDPQAQCLESGSRWGRGGHRAGFQMSLLSPTAPS